MKRQDIVKALVERGYRAEEQETTKNGVIFEGIIIRSDDAIAPVIYTDRLIADAEQRGAGLDEVVAQVIRQYEDREPLAFEVGWLYDREFCLSHLRIGLQRESSEEIEKKAVEDLPGIEAYLYIGVTDRDTMASARVNRQLLQSAGVSVCEAWAEAEKNTFAETIMQSMAQVMGELLGQETAEDDGTGLYVISNRQKMRGASGILNHKILAEFAKRHGVESVVVLPSSIHEMLILPYTPGMDIDELSEMVRAINADIVAPEERLTDRAYVIRA